MTLHIPIDPDMKEELRKRSQSLAKSLGVSVSLSEYVRRVLRESLESSADNNPPIIDKPVVSAHIASRKSYKP